MTIPEYDVEAQVATVLGSPERLRSVHEPIVDLRNGDSPGFQAMVRVAEWPARSPHPWFTAAARAGLGAHLEAAAIGASLRARAAMPGDRFLAVRVSSSSLAHPLVRDVLADADDLGGVLLTAAPTAEVLEPHPAAGTLSQLRGRGLLVAAEVGPAGRPELAAVHRLRPDVVTVGSQLIRDVHADPVRGRIVRMAVELADELRAAVLADGVETLDEARFLQQAGVRMASGWLFGRPRPGFLPPPGEIAALLRAAWAGSAHSPG